MNQNNIAKYNLSDTDIRLAHLIKKRRIELGLRQHEVAKRLGVTRGNVAQFEMGRNKLNHNTLKNIAEILEKPISYFVGDEKKYREQESLEKSKDEIKELLKTWKLGEYIKYKNLPENFQKDLKTYIEYLCELYEVKVEEIW
jgi:transcriptional regulator with XRE-family HTH domain